MSAQGSDSNSWNFDIFDVDHIFSSNYYDPNHYDVNISHEPFLGENHFGSICSCIDGEETRALSLGDEFSQLSIGEAPESLPMRDEYLQVSSNIQDSHFPSRAYHTGYRFGPEETYDGGPSNYYSSDGEQSNEGDGYSYDLEITDELELDGEVGKRLNQMVPIPHVPKINGDIPSVDEATSDHQRLLYRLQLYDLVEHKVEGDGNCQFRALSDQIYHTQEHHEFVRQQVVGQYGMKIFVITSYKDTCYIEILPKMQESKRVIYLSFWAEVHYNSFYLQADLLPSDFKKKKKKWWRFGNKE